MENKKNTGSSSKEFVLFKKVSTIDKYNFYEYLSVMLDSGVTISESLESVDSKVKNIYFKQKLRELVTYISSGDSFSKSMKKIPQIFNQAEVSIIESGEATGGLSSSLSRLSESLKKKHNLRSKIKSSLTYPMIIFVFLVIAVILVLTYVIPSIKPLFDTAEVELPMATKSLIFTSDFIVNNFLTLILFLLSLFVLLLGYKNTASGKVFFDNALLGIPLVGTVYKNYILSGVAASIGSLMGSGVNVVKTLSLVGKSTNNVIYEDIFNRVTAKVSGGEKIVDSMQSIDPQNIYFPSDFLQMLSVGERTANLEKVSKKIDEQYVREIDYSLSRLTKWIEPIAILIAGVFVLWFAFAIFGAILRVTDTVG